MYRPDGFRLLRQGSFQMVITWYLDISRPGKLAEQLRQQVAGLRGAEKAFSYCGVRYTVSGHNEVKIFSQQTDLPRPGSLNQALAELLCRVQIEASDTPCAMDIAGDYKRPNAWATVERRAGGKYCIGLTGNTLAATTRLWEDIFNGRAGKAHRTMR